LSWVRFFIVKLVAIGRSRASIDLSGLFLTKAVIVAVESLNRAATVETIDRAPPFLP
jgi:hypothetical protein